MRIALRCIAALALLGASGCSSIKLRPSAPNLAVPSSATKDQVVALVNRNVTGVEGNPGLTGWSCRQARFDLGPLMKASGVVMVEAPHSFRLRVSNPLGGGDELDVGSNNEEFWIWQKGMEPPAILTAQHEDMGLALQHFRIPFQPDWIMEVLGVIPIEAEDYELRPSSKRYQMELIADSRSQTGDVLRKVIRVDTKRGWVMAHELWKPEGQLIASAVYSDHQADKVTKILMPRKIQVRWPEADLNLGIELQHLEVNPPHLPELVWTLPVKPGCRKLDMGDYARRQVGGPAEIQHVDHEPARSVMNGPPSDAPFTPAPQSAAAEAALGGPRPFPAEPSSAAAVTQPGPADLSDALPSSGRVRLDSLGP